MRLIHRLAAIACWLAVAFAYVAAVLPAREAPHLGGSDKLDHMAAFFTITLLARLGYQRTAPWLIFLWAAAFGALIELTQALPFIHRDAEVADWIADVIATLLGLLAAWPVLAMMTRIERGRG